MARQIDHEGVAQWIYLLPRVYAINHEPHHRLTSLYETEKRLNLQTGGRAGERAKGLQARKRAVERAKGRRARRQAKYRLTDRRVDGQKADRLENGQKADKLTDGQESRKKERQEVDRSM